VDIYRSAHPESNDYVYHNVGKEVNLLDINNNPIAVNESTGDRLFKSKDLTGLRFIQSLKGTDAFDGSVKAVFIMEDELSKPGRRFMKVLMTGEKNRNYFTGLAPATKTVLPAYAALKTPTLVVKQQGEAWTRPFVAVYEPYSGNGDQIQSVEIISSDEALPASVVRVTNKDSVVQLVFQSGEDNQLISKGNWQFKGTFAVVQLKKGMVEELYLGSGSSIRYGDYSISSNVPDAAGSLKIDGSKARISGNHDLTVTIKNKTIKVPAGKEMMLNF
jgi:hypothetical protein